MGDFTNKVVVVTGGSRGIVRAYRAMSRAKARRPCRGVPAGQSRAAAAAIGNSGPKPLTSRAT